MDEMSYRKILIYLLACLTSMALLYEVRWFQGACVMALVSGMYIEGLAEKWKLSQVSATPVTTEKP